MHAQVHDINQRFCHCGECETRRTKEVSPHTADHIEGRFDVDKARYEVQRDRNDVSGMLMGWV